MVAFFVPIGLMGAAPPLVLTYLGSSQNTSGSGSTHPGMNFGTPDPNRYLIAACAIVSSSSAITAVDFAGVAGTKLVDVVSGFGSVRTAYWIALVPTGTSGGITFTAGSGGVSSVALYSAVNLLSAAAFDTASDSGNSPLSMSLGVQSGGFILATAYMSGSPGTTAAWTGLTAVDLNLQFGGGAQQHSAGHYLATTATTRALSVTLSGTNAFSSCAVSMK